MSDSEQQPIINPQTREEFLDSMGLIYDLGKVDLTEQTFLIVFLPQDTAKSDALFAAGAESFGRLEHLAMLVHWLNMAEPIREFSIHMRNAVEFARAQEIAKKRTGLVAASHIHPGLPRA